MQRCWREAGTRNGCWIASRGCVELVTALFMGVRRMRSWREIGGVWISWWREMMWKLGRNGEGVFDGRRSEEGRLEIRFTCKRAYPLSASGSSTCDAVVFASHLALDPAFPRRGNPYVVDSHLSKVDDRWKESRTASALARFEQKNSTIWSFFTRWHHPSMQTTQPAETNNPYNVWGNPRNVGYSTLCPIYLSYK